MARGVNKVILVGHLGADPQIKTIQNGNQLARFNIATTETSNTQEGNQQKRTEWHSIVAWGKLQGICQKYLKKGRQVYIEGSLQSRSWEDKKGANQRITEIVAKQIVLLGSREAGRQDQQKN